jgi:hypothetical protein
MSIVTFVQKPGLESVTVALEQTWQLSEDYSLQLL